MFYPNYNPFYMRSYNYMHNNIYNNTASQVKAEPKKDTASQNDTIPFQDFCNYSPKDNQESDTPKNKLFSIKNNTIHIFGYSIQIDDLILIGLIILLFMDTEENNMALIIILGLMLLNINLGDILNLF